MVSHTNAVDHAGPTLGRQPAVRRKRRRGLVYPFLLIAPAQLMLILSIFLPSIYVGWLSFFESSFGQAPVFVGWENYIRIATDPYFWDAFWNTFIVVNIIAYAEILLGIGIAVFLASGAPFPRTLMTLMLIPYSVSEVANAIMWKTMLDPQNGIVQWALRGLGLPEIPWQTEPLAALTVIAFMAVWHHLPFTVLILYAALLNIPKDLYEAARLDGATSWQLFWRITLRLLMPAILVAMLFRFIFAFRIFVEVQLLTQGGPARTTEVLSIYLYNAGFRYNEFGLASAVAWAMAMLGMLIAVPYLFLMFKRGRANAI